MLDRCDRVQIAVHDAATAAQRFRQLLGGEVARRDHSRHLSARRMILAVGESADPDSLAKRWQGLGAPCGHDGEQLYDVADRARLGMVGSGTPAMRRQ